MVIMKKVFNLLVVDESGSMSVIKDQALAGLNETLETVRKMQEVYPEKEQRVTLLTFDSDHRHVLFDNVPASQTRKLSGKDYRPGGATPLYDAIGEAVSRLNAQAQAGGSVLVTIITDGMENCSKEYNLPMVKNLVEKMKGQGWTFTLIGTDNLDVEDMACQMAIADHLSFKEDAVGTHEMFLREKKARVRYNECLACQAPIGSYFREDDENE